MSNLRQQLAGEGGYTAIELAVVVAISAIVLGIAATAYAGFGDRAAAVVGRSNIRTAVPVADAYYADYGNYSFTKLRSGLPAATPLDALRSYEEEIDVGLVVRPEEGGTKYCLVEVHADGAAYFFFGPGGKISDALATSGPPGSTPTCG